MTTSVSGIFKKKSRFSLLVGEAVRISYLGWWSSRHVQYEDKIMPREHGNLVNFTIFIFFTFYL